MHCTNCGEPSRIGYPARPMALVLVTPAPVEGGPLTVRLDGPFQQPAPQLRLHVDGQQVIAQVVVQDFVIPNQPPVASVQATIPAPAAGDYVLVERLCAGLPPPPLPLCTVASQQGFAVSEAFSVPAGSAWALVALGLGLAALAAQRIERALTALERLRV